MTFGYDLMSARSNKAPWSINRDLHIPPKSPYWFACYRDEHGRRVRRSTKTTDAEEAEEIAMKWAQLAETARAGRLTEAQCRKVIAEMYERTTGEPLHFRTAREWLTEWLEGKRNETEVRSFLKYQQITNDFLAHIGTKADRLLRDISKADIRSWRDALKRKGLSAPTINQAVKT